MAVAEVFRSSRDRHFDAAVEKLRMAVQAMAAWVDDAEAEGLGEALIQIREVGIDPLEAVFATGLRRFDKSGEYKAEGALSLTAWLRWKCKLSGGAALERVEVARQLEKLPETTAAFANGDVGFQHVAVLARTAEHVGAAAVRKEEGTLLQAAQTMDPGQFVTVAKNFEHRVDAAGALAEANHAYQRPGRARARAQSRQPDLAGANPARARVARPALRLPGLHQTTELVRRAPPRVVDARRRDGAAQPRDALPAASPHGPRRRLVPRAREG